MRIGDWIEVSVDGMPPVPAEIEGIERGDDDRIVAIIAAGVKVYLELLN